MVGRCRGTPTSSTRTGSEAGRDRSASLTPRRLRGLGGRVGETPPPRTAPSPSMARRSGCPRHGFRIDTTGVEGDRWAKNLIGFRGGAELGLNAGAAVGVGAFQLVKAMIPWTNGGRSGSRPSP